uniref:V-type proton ATPase subunit a n=1 Tax=Philasterides dicentrarchi TaxID=282688 RepID=A0A481SC95_9CILI|nr:V-type proton ATPase subunit a [Philasterides dicentrarchi]
MSLFRSQKMKYCHLICNEDSAWDTLNELGEMSTLHFVDPEPNLPLINRPFANYIKRCEEVDFKLQFIKENAIKFQQEIKQCKDYPQLIKYYKKTLEDRSTNEGKKDGKTYFLDLEQEIGDQHKWLEEQLKHYESLQEKKNLLREYKAVLINAKKVFGDTFFQLDNKEQNMDIHAMGLEQILENASQMSSIVGLIDASEALRFQRMVFRVTKGNTYSEIKDIDWQDDPIIDPQTLLPLDKKVFIIIYPRSSMDIIKNKLNRICDSFNCSKFGIPQYQAEYIDKLHEIEEQKKESASLVEMTKYNLVQYFKEWTKIRNGCNCSKVEEFRLYTVKEKGLYHTLNLLKTDQKIYQGYAWIPKSDVDAANNTLVELGRRNPEVVGGQIKPQKKPSQSIEKPPTAFKLNEFTSVFQLITNTYGTPRYREINPGLFSLATFPFLFGVMFGDMAHGFLLFCFGLFLVLNNKNLQQTALAPLCYARFFILFMGFFATYCGFLYNDFLSLSFNFFGSCYDATTPQTCPGTDPKQGFECYLYNQKNVTPAGSFELKTCVYPFGLDPIWSIADNNITFINSYKMKLAVIFGVIQMSLGILLKGWNAISFKQPIDFIFEFIPQITFMALTFGYMDFMIIYKWFCNFQEAESQFAPSIITLLINMPLKFGSPDGPVLYGDPSDPANGLQQKIQMIFLIIALIMVPMMLIPKPIILYYKSKSSRPSHQLLQQGSQQNLQNPLLGNEYHDHSNVGIQKQSSSIEIGLEKELEASLLQKSEQDHHQGDDHGFGELFVHQVIETIEFVLGSISNTASYLRLWALSLAHGQLAKVFFEKTLGGGIQGGNIIAIFIGLTLFVIITLGVIMAMDLMECFLHALRLQWVEFQNKFYKADGYKFEPFSFQTALKTVEV